MKSTDQINSLSGLYRHIAPDIFYIGDVSMIIGFTYWCRTPIANSRE